jgi:hypothetical protein
LFVSGSEPRQTETYYVRLPSGEVAVAPPANARAWAIDAGLVLAGETKPGGKSLQIESPGDRTTLFAAPELKTQEVLLRATAGPDVRAIALLLDGREVGTFATGDARVAVPLGPGSHHLTATATYGDGSTLSKTSSFEVRPK